MQQNIYDIRSEREKRKSKQLRKKRRRRRNFLRAMVRTFAFILLLYGIFLLSLSVYKKISTGETISFAATSYTVVLDAGHGGKDSGAIQGETYEKDINLAVVQKLQKLLKEKKVKVILTRKDDTFLELSERTDISNRYHPDLFVSIHCNSLENNSPIAGLECYYEEGSELGENTALALWDALCQNDSVDCRKVMGEDFYVLRNNNYPALLIELGYLTNIEERKELESDAGQTILANALAEAIIETLSSQ